MEKFVVSARKYRPDTFETLIGQENIAVTLKNSIIRGQLAHAYLFCGPRGVGKTSTARIFAKTINCFNPGKEMEPCGECESCISFAQGRSFSIHELDAASNNSVDDIRQLNELVRIPPQVGKYSVYIIDEVHMLSQSAFNAFLKTLEEPPSYAIFILATTEKHKILPTILSRCQTYDFNRISIENIVKNLSAISIKEEIEVETEALHVIAQKADGAMRDALTLLDQAIAFSGSKITYQGIISILNVLDYEYYLNITNHILAGEHTQVLIIFDEILSKGFNALHFIGGLSTHFRDLLVCKDKSTIALLELAPSLIERYQQQAQNCSLPFLYEALNITSSCEAGYKSSGNQRLHIEIALLRLCKINIETVLQQPQVQQQAQAQPKQSQPLPKPLPEPQPLQAQPESQQPQPQPLQPEPLQPQPQPQQPQPQSLQAQPQPQTVSIKSLLKSASEKTNVEKKRPAIGTTPLEVNRVTEIWKLMAESEKKLPRLSTTISQSTPIIKEQNTILFIVKNELQKNWINERCKVRLVEFLRLKLDNSEVELEVVVSEDEEPSQNKMYMPQEKAKFLSDNYPQVKELQKDLNLELK